MSQILFSRKKAFGAIMNIGLLLPVKKKKWKPVSLEIRYVEILEDINLVVCYISCLGSDAIYRKGTRRRLKAKLDAMFREGNVWPVFEHSWIKGFYQSKDYRFDEILREVAVGRTDEIISKIKGLGILANKEILVTGQSAHLEYAIEKLITKVKTMNILIPEGASEPREAEKAFAETGIPVHITTDFDILKRVRLWLRFPDDHESFDVLPERFDGTIVDLGAMKIIDTKLRKIFSINIEFSDRIKRRIGQQILNSLEKGALEGFMVAVCANAWDISVSEASVLLDMRLSFQS
ncbi:MAG TPA: hypothetical protein GXX26_08225 [Clostridiaceae bacterium]|nr:hypothetical protein [Clostridiaceae bacterium]